MWPQDRRDNRDGPRGHYAKSNEPDRRRQTPRGIASGWHLKGNGSSSAAAESGKRVSRPGLAEQGQGGAGVRGCGGAGVQLGAGSSETCTATGTGTPYCRSDISKRNASTQADATLHEQTLNRVVGGTCTGVYETWGWPFGTYSDSFKNGVAAIYDALCGLRAARLRCVSSSSSSAIPCGPTVVTPAGGRKEALGGSRSFSEVTRRHVVTALCAVGGRAGRGGRGLRRPQRPPRAMPCCLVCRARPCWPPLRSRRATRWPRGLHR